MSDHLLDYYQRELAFIRQLGTEFAQQYPKIAGRIRLGPDQMDDPLVGRLIESCRADERPDSPEARRRLSRDRRGDARRSLPALPRSDTLDGDRPVRARSRPGKANRRLHDSRGIRDRDRSPARDPGRRALPVSDLLSDHALAAANPSGRTAPSTIPRTPPGERSSEASWVLHIGLECLDVDTDDPKLKIAELGLDTLRLFLLGKHQYVFELYEALFLNVVEVVVATSTGTRKAASLDPDCLRQVGFGLDEGMLPYPARSFPGYRLLTEFFAFPSKFLFFDVPD